MNDCAQRMRGRVSTTCSRSAAARRSAAGQRVRGQVFGADGHRHQRRCSSSSRYLPDATTASSTRSPPGSDTNSDFPVPSPRLQTSNFRLRSRPQTCDLQLQTSRSPAPTSDFQLQTSPPLRLRPPPSALRLDPDLRLRRRARSVAAHRGEASRSAPPRSRMPSRDRRRARG